MAYKEVNPFYKSKKWKRKRGVIMRHYDYLCQESRKYGMDVAAEAVHHIFPLEEYPELALVNWNLLPVTNKKHNTFHSREDNSITVKGKYWQQKRMREFNEFYAQLNKDK